MGMHFGIVVADVDAARFIAALDAAAPRFVDRGTIDSLDELATAGDPEWQVAVGELEGRAYLVDSFAPASSDVDVIVAASAATGGLVIGCGAETISDTVYLIAARAGRLLRDYSAVSGDVSSKGAPIPGEPKGDLDAAALFAVLAAHGFDYERWYRAAPKRRLVWLDAAEA